MKGFAERTSRLLLGKLDSQMIPEEEITEEGGFGDDPPPDGQESELLRVVETNLEALVAGSDIDPRVQVLLHYLREGGWLEYHGAIVFSHYLTTAEWVLEARAPGAALFLRPPLRSAACGLTFVLELYCLDKVYVAPYGSTYPVLFRELAPWMMQQPSPIEDRCVAASTCIIPIR